MYGSAFPVVAPSLLAILASCYLLQGLMTKVWSLIDNCGIDLRDRNDTGRIKLHIKLKFNTATINIIGQIL
jgi:hypothetical protein